MRRWEIAAVIEMTLRVRRCEGLIGLLISVIGRIVMAVIIMKVVRIKRGIMSPRYDKKR